MFLNRCRTRRLRSRRPAIEHNADLLVGRVVFRVARRMLLTGVSDDAAPIRGAAMVGSMVVLAINTYELQSRWSFRQTYPMAAGQKRQYGWKAAALGLPFLKALFIRAGLG